MKKSGLSLLILMLAFSPACRAAETSPAPLQSKPIPPRSQAEQKKLDEKRKMIIEKREELNGSKWVLSVNSSDPKLKGQKDTFFFQDGNFHSEALSKRGFAATNYTITLPATESDLAVWETMQTGKDGMVFIRGEWQKEKMTVYVTEQLEGGKKVKEYSYTTAAREAIPTSSKEDGTKAQNDSVSRVSESGVLVSGETPKVETEPIDNKEVIESFKPGTTEEAITP